MVVGHRGHVGRGLDPVASLATFGWMPDVAGLFFYISLALTRHEFSDSNSIADLAMLVQQKQGLLQLDQTEFTMTKRRSVILPKES